MINISEEVKHVLVSAEELDTITTALAKKISEDFEGKNLVLLGILKGSVPFMSDIMRKITLPAELEFMKVSSYGAGTVSTGNLKIHLDILRDGLENCDFLIIEDIIDSGRTLSMLVEHLNKKGARSVKTCTLLDKPSRREVNFTTDYVGKEIPDHFVVGYGLDFDEKYRTLPYVGIPNFVFENK
ncbi:MAG: hypoxanthine phosphoribosyltransferase [Clostridia bacterium]|nr:hypoxanthine phosphoribosyltransferase [Clostridia bacterium]